MKALIISLSGLLLGCWSLCAAQDLESMLIKDGERLFELKNYREAESRFKKLVLIRPKNALGYYYLARIYLEAGPLQDSTKARTYYARAKQYKIEFKGKIKRIEALEREGPEQIPVAPEIPTASPQERVSQEEQETTQDAQVSPEGGEGPPRPEESVPALEPPPAVRPPPASPPLEIGLPKTEDLYPEETGQEEEESLPEEIDSEVLPNIKETRLGEILAKEERGESLNYDERLALQVFREGSKMCIRKIQRGLCDEGRGFAKDVIRVAPDFWQGYYLMALVALECEEDFVEAKDWWTKAEATGYALSRDWPDLAEQIITDPQELLKRYLGYARKHMKNENWIEAEDVLIKTQDIEDLPSSESVRRAFAEVDFRLGEIAYHLKDYEKAIEDMEAGIEGGYRQKDTQQDTQQLIRKARTAKDSVDNLPVERKAIAVEPMRFSGLARGYGSVRLDLKKDYFTAVATTNLGGGRSEPTRELDGQTTTYEVQGGRVYTIEFDRRQQLRKAVLQGISAVALIGLLLIL